MPERKIHPYLPSENPDILNDSRTYEGRGGFMADYLLTKMLPATQNIFNRLQSGERNFVGGNDALLIKGGIIMMAFSKEHCPLGLEVDMNDRVRIVANPGADENKEMMKQSHASHIKGSFRPTESYIVDIFYDYPHMESFFRYMRAFRNRKNKPVAIFGALDSPTIALGTTKNKEIHTVRSPHAIIRSILRSRIDNNQKKSP